MSAGESLAAPSEAERKLFERSPDAFLFHVVQRVPVSILAPAELRGRQRAQIFRVVSRRLLSRIPDLLSREIISRIPEGRSREMNCRRLWDISRKFADFSQKFAYFFPDFCQKFADFPKSMHATRTGVPRS